MSAPVIASDIPTTPAPGFNPKSLNTKIGELEARPTLSKNGGVFLRFLKLQREFAGHDQWIVHIPESAVATPGQEVAAQIVEVTAEKAADMLAYAAQRGVAARLAREDEIAAAQAFEEENRQHVMRRTSAQAQAVARASAEAIFGQTLPPAAVASNEPGPKPPTPGIVEPPKAGPDPEMLTPTNVASDPLSKVAGANAAKLASAGFDSLEKLANASPDDLVKLDGIGQKVAAKLIVKAGEALAQAAGTSAVAGE